MTRRSTSCHLRIPGLLGPVPADALHLLQQTPERQHLARLLSRARPCAVADAVPGAPGFRLDAGGDDLPAGPLGLLGAGGDPGDDFWFRADPVHLLPDRDQLRLLGPEALSLGHDEADQLVAALNEHFRADGLELVAPLPGAWFLRCPATPRLTTVPLEKARDVALSAVQPSGPDASWWQARLNEMQMLLHAHPVNQARDAHGALTVNGLWPWGGGALPAVSSDWAMVFSNDPVTRGLAIAAGVPVRDWPADPAAVSDVAGQGPVLASAPPLSQVRDGESFVAWEAELDLLAGAWAPLLEGTLRSGRFAAVTIDGGQHGTCRRLTRAGLRAFWRRRRPFAAFLSTT